MRAWLMIVALVAAGCAQKIGASDGDSGARDAGARTDGSFPTQSGAFTHAIGAEGVITTIADASNTSTWQHLDLDTGLSTDASDAWDLAFSRFRVRTNGGVSGGGGVLVAALEGQRFESITRAPDEGWTAARPDGPGDDDLEADNAFNNGERDWYDYEVETHALTPRDVTYVIASTEARFYKLRFEAYYDDAGSPAILRFRWAEVEAPASALPDAGPPPADGGVPVLPDAGEDPLPAGAIVVDASDSTEWVYLDVVNGVVTPASPETDLGWDLALRRTEVRTNGGASGAGLGGARLAEGATFEAITEATTLGYTVDEEVESSRPGAEPTSLSAVLAAWYDYNPATHTVSPGDRTYLVRTADGEYAKLRFWRWRDGEHAISFEPVARAVTIAELDVDATASDAWTYVSLRDGAIVDDVEDASSDARWDVGFSRTRIRTNGGTSGAGLGAAVETDAAALSALTEAPAEGFAVDALLSEGMPGSSEHSGSPAFASWYDYDPVTHGVSPRPVVFAVRTADGNMAALRILSYASGAYRVELAFAGPGHTDFF